jgi:serine/threonine protein kinase
MEVDSCENYEKTSNKSNFEKNENIGSGTYGMVYKGFNKITEETIAIKKMKMETDKEGIPSSALREICTLKELIHPNVVQLKDVVTKNYKIYLVFEYLEMDLKKYIDIIPSKIKLDNRIIKYFMFQLLDGLAYCHAKKIMHRDLKPANLLLNKNGKLKIADFGLARIHTIPLRPYTKEVCKIIFNYL